MLQQSKAALETVSQEAVTLYFPISFEGGPESKCTGIFSSKILGESLGFPKHRTEGTDSFLWPLGHIGMIPARGS